MTAPGFPPLRFPSGPNAALVATALPIAGTVACGAGDDAATPTLRRYTNPDNGQEDLAAKCTAAAGGDDRIEVAVLPSDADGQRVQLVRRLAANDSSIDLMVLENPEAGKDARPTLDSGAGRSAARIIRQVATRVADPALSTAIEENARGPATVGPDSTPDQADDLIHDVLRDRQLL